MNRPHEARLLVHSRTPGPWNMAVDEGLLDNALDSGTATLRFYTWREPTLSLGYFQRYQDRAQHAPSDALPVVRRLTGGGALVHDHELTYALAVGRGSAPARNHQLLYDQVHQAIGRVLSRHEIKVVAAHELAQQPAPTRRDPFLCFQRRSNVDLVAAPVEARNPAKILGSAQRRRRGAILQHGSLLLAASARAPSLPGIHEISGRRLDERQLITELAAEVAEGLDLNLRRGSLTPVEQQQAARLVDSRYGCAQWTRRR